MSEPNRPRPDPIETWVFDLDNTLYSSSSDLAAQMSVRMASFIVGLLGVEAEQAKKIQKQYFRDYGTTMRGLMTMHDIDPHRYLDHVHDIDLKSLAASPALRAALEKLPGRKLVHTNASVKHAERILDRLGVADHFSGIFDIAAADWQPKPDPLGYAGLIQRFGLVPTRSAMVEDIARNLKPAADHGMFTLWVRTGHDWAIEGAMEEWVHESTDDLPAWLAAYRPAADSTRPVVDSTSNPQDRARLLKPAE